MAVRTSDDTRSMIEAAEAMAACSYVLRLYVAGMTPRSAEAIRRVTGFCDKHLSERFELQIIDIYQTPSLATGEQIVAVPTLVKVLPEPLRRFIGTMQDEEKLLFGMDLFPTLDREAALPE